MCQDCPQDVQWKLVCSPAGTGTRQAASQPGQRCGIDRVASRLSWTLYLVTPQQHAARPAVVRGEGPYGEVTIGTTSTGTCASCRVRRSVCARASSIC